VRAADPAHQPLVVEHGVGAGAAGHHHDLGIGQVLERRVGLDAEHAVVCSHDTRLVSQPGHARAGQAREHLVGAHSVEGGEAVVQRDGDSHAACLLNLDR
jgi:hypothetical protein